MTLIITYFCDLGSLHQGDGMLVVYTDTVENKTYDLAIQTVHAMGEVIDVLYKRAQVSGPVA
jgi:26S proteasome regulatory subunit N6